jgi:hypothetical protein
LRYKALVTLAEYLKESGLTAAEFGAKCSPPIHRTSIWLYKMRRRTPGAPIVASIEKASGYRVRAEDLGKLPISRHRTSSHSVADS